MVMIRICNFIIKFHKDFPFIAFIKDIIMILLLSYMPITGTQITKNNKLDVASKLYVVNGPLFDSNTTNKVYNHDASLAYWNRIPQYSSLKMEKNLQKKLQGLSR